MFTSSFPRQLFLDALIYFDLLPVLIALIWAVLGPCRFPIQQTFRVDVGVVGLNSVSSLQMCSIILEWPHVYHSTLGHLYVSGCQEGHCDTSDLTTFLPGYLNLIPFQAVLRLVSKLPIFAMNTVVLLRISVYPVCLVLFQTLGINSTCL